jgi:hypothetical protein
MLVVSGDPFFMPARPSVEKPGGRRTRTRSFYAQCLPFRDTRRTKNSRRAPGNGRGTGSRPESKPNVVRLWKSASNYRIMSVFALAMERAPSPENFPHVHSACVCIAARFGIRFFYKEGES